MDVILPFIALAIAGFVIGIFSGLLGIGGGTIMVPMLRLGFGLSAFMATATSLFTIIPTSISGAVKHVRNKTCLPALGLAAGLGGAITSPIGVWLAARSQSWMIMLAAGIIIVYSAYNMFKKAMAAPKDDTSKNVAAKAPAAETAEAPVATAEVSAAAAPEVKLSRSDLMKGAVIGLIAGLASGYVGVGGGFLMVPLFLSLVNVPMKLASGTSLIAVMILATPGTIEQAILGNIDYVAGIALAVGSVPGAVVGANLSRRVPERKLRFVFSFFLLFAAAMLLIKEAGLLG